MEENIEYRIDGVELISFELKRKPRSFKGNVFEFPITAKHTVNQEKQLVIVFVSISVKEADNDEVFATLEIGCGFHILKNFEAIKIGDDGTYHLPLMFAYTLTMVSIGTARGVLYSELKATYLHKAVLPVVQIDPQQMNKMLTPME